MDTTKFSLPVNREGASATSVERHSRNGVGAMTDEFKTNANLRAEQRAFFADNLKRRMQELEMNQSDLARAVWQETVVDKRGYGQPKRKDRISVYCKGKAMPQPGVLAKIAKVLDTTPEALASTPTKINTSTQPGWMEKPRAIFAANLNRRMQELGLNQTSVAWAVWPDSHIDAKGHRRSNGIASMSAYCLGRTLPTFRHHG